MTPPPHLETTPHRTPDHAASTAPTQAPAPLLTIENLTKVFRTDIFRGPQTALDRVSMTFPAGCCTGLLGHNGAGKTTTIRLILGLIRPDKGKIVYEGRPLDLEARRQIGYMPEINKLPGALTPLEILEHQISLYRPDLSRRDRKERVALSLDAVALSEHGKKRLSKLSKGMARRVAFAQATLHEPRLLILDEPASGLDPLGRRQMLHWITALRGKGTTIVLCTHELAQVGSLCDRFYVLRRGQVVYSSAAGSDLAAAPSWQLHAAGLSSAAVQDIAAATQLAAPHSLTPVGHAISLGFRSYEAASSWLAALLERGIVVTRFGDDGFAAEEDLLRFFEVTHS